MNARAFFWLLAAWLKAFHANDPRREKVLADLASVREELRRLMIEFS